MPAPKSDEPLLPLLLEGSGIAPEELALGEIVGIFGVRGELRMHLFNRESDWLERWRDVVLVAPDGRRYAARVKTREGAGERVIAVLDGLTDRDVARRMQGCTLVVDRARLPKPAEGEVYVWQMLGLPVVDPAGVVRGKITEVHTNCPTPILEIEVPGRTDPSFVPLIPGQVLVELDAARVVIPQDALEEA